MDSLVHLACTVGIVMGAAWLAWYELFREDQQAREDRLVNHLAHVLFETNVSSLTAIQADVVTRLVRLELGV